MGSYFLWRAGHPAAYLLLITAVCVGALGAAGCIARTPETVSQLFEVGPNAYTPGTKMPEQRIGSADDRRALTDFLARVTAK